MSTSTLERRPLVLLARAAVLACFAAAGCTPGDGGAPADPGDGPAGLPADAQAAPGTPGPHIPPTSAGAERESLLYIWSRDASGNGTDFIAVVDADPDSDTYGEIVATASAGSSGNEAHHFGYTSDASRIFAGGMFTNRLFLYDVGDDPSAPRLVRTVDLEDSGFVGPHTPYAVPGGMLLAMMGGAGGGPGAVLELDEEGGVRRAYVAPDEGRPIHLYDVTLNPRGDRVFASSFAHAEQFVHGVPDPAHVANEVVIWDRASGEVVQVEELDLSTVVLRWLHAPEANAGYVPSGFGGTIWYWHDEGDDGRYAFERVLELPEGSFPVDLRITPDDRSMFVTLWAAGLVQQYDISDPRAPRLVDQAELPQPNMMLLSPDGERLYVTNSILSSLDGDVPFAAWLFEVGPDGMTHDPTFAPEFEAFAAGRAGPHDMLMR
jgi:methanethiol oxidase